MLMMETCEAEAAAVATAAAPAAPATHHPAPRPWATFPLACDRPTCLRLHPGRLVLEHHVHAALRRGQLGVDCPRKRVDPLDGREGYTPA